MPLKQQAGEYFLPPRPLPLYGEAYPTYLGDTGQTVWLQLDGPRSSTRGYREISVSDMPLRTDAAILAALTALEGKPLDLCALRRILAKIVPPRNQSFFDLWSATSADKRAEDSVWEDLQDVRRHQALDYVLMLLRYHRPGFDDLSP